MPVSTPTAAVRLRAVPFDLKETFECGQCFRWDPDSTGGYRGIVGRRVVTLRQDGDFLMAEGLTQPEAEALLVPYLALDEDYAAIHALFRENETLARAVDYAPGIRVLRQDRWEALCSFILSQNNNIKRIKGIIARLCESFGEPLGGGDYAFPGPEVLASLSEEDLAPLRCGFRARYVLDAARKGCRRRGGPGCGGRPAHRGGRCGAAGHLRRRHQGGPLRAALRLPPHRVPAGGCVDAPGDGHPLPEWPAAGAAPLCGHRPAISVPLLPLPNRYTYSGDGQPAKGDRP